MFIKASFLSLVALTSLSVTYARELIIERDGRPFYPRRFGQEQCGGIGGQIGSACAGNICGVLGGRVPGTLLAGAGECAQQDLADDIIDASKDQDAATAATLVALAIQFRQCEKNTPPDFSTNPPTLRNSVFCQTAPRNAELIGLVQAQDPANDPNLFFDPVTKATVTLGSQANTFALGAGGAAQGGGGAVAVTTRQVEAAATGALDFGSCTNPSIEFGPGFEGRKLTELSFKPENQDEFSQGSALNGNIVTFAICNILNDRCGAPDETVAACRAAVDAVANVAGGAKADQFNAALGIQTNFANVQAAVGGGVGSIAASTTADFNKCAAPQIAFGIFDGRKENSFAPVGNDFIHGSALNPLIITDFVCDQLVNKCDANQIAIDRCAAAITATQGLTGQAVVDAFNSVVLGN